MMDTQETYVFSVEEENQGTRLDLLLTGLLAETSRSYIQKLIEDGFVTINGRTELSKKCKCKMGDEIRLILPQPEKLEAVAQDIPVDIVYEDSDLVVVDKPKGMVVHPAAGNPDGTLVNALLFHCDSLSSINGVIRPGIVHRIDKDTSGLLMVAKNDKAHRCLAAQLADHSINRVYHAVCYHNFTEDEGTVDAPIGRDPKNRLRMAVNRVNGKNAVTHYEVMERFGAFTYITARLETGRTHQIRVHMAHIHHPLLGDSVYGPKKKLYGAESQMLHARILGFQHPSSGQYMEFESELPAEFTAVLNKLRAIKS